MNNTTKAVGAMVTRSKMVSVEEALSYLLERARPVLETEVLPLERLRGRIVAYPQRSLIDVPAFDNSSMDGIAVRSQDTADSTVTLEVAQRIAAGNTGVPLLAGQAARIFTGAPLPEGADAVVMQEDCDFSAQQVSFKGPVAAGLHVRPRGNNIERGNDILAAGTRIRPQELGIAAAVGLAELPVFRRLKVAFFSSGDELVEPGRSLEYGQIYNSNRYTLRGLVDGLGCEVIDLGIVEDSLTATKSLLREAAERADVVISSGGVSVGEEDHIKAAIESVGRLEMWNIASNLENQSLTAV
jgi:molybdopterin molybdotransferase